MNFKALVYPDIFANLIFVGAFQGVFWLGHLFDHDYAFLLIFRNESNLIISPDLFVLMHCDML